MKDLFGENERDMDILTGIEKRIATAQARYGAFASTHEAIGVACEEWDELRSAVHANKLVSVELECLDLASVLIKLVRDLRNQETSNRSVK